MEDLTTGSLSRHLMKTASFMLVTMVFQTLYFLVDLYWVGRLGKEAVAAVAIAGNLMFVVLAVTQMLGVGTTALVTHAVGRKERDVALHVFNQSQVLSVLAGVLFFVVAMAARACMRAAWPPTRPRRTGERLSHVVHPGHVDAVRAGRDGRGVARHGQLQAGHGRADGDRDHQHHSRAGPDVRLGSGRPLGVAGAAIASLVAVTVGVAWLRATSCRRTRFCSSSRRRSRRTSPSGRRCSIGLPAGAEFGLIAVYLLIVYVITRPFGAAAQAGFGIGLRIMQARFMPVVALGFAVAPVAGQNFGARKGARVIQTFPKAAVMAAGVMLAFGVVCHTVPSALIGLFSGDPEVIAVGSEYLRISSWNFIASGIIFVASSTFQAMGNTMPALVTSTLRILLVAIPAFLVSGWPGFELRWIWYLSVGSIVLQMTASLLLLRREFRLRLTNA